MRLTANLPVASLNRLRAYRYEPGSPYDAPAQAERLHVIAGSMIAGWTEMVIQGDREDSHVFLIAGTSHESAPDGRRRNRFDRTCGKVGISHQAIKR